MPRTTAQPTDANPQIATFTAPSLDLTIDTADLAPVQLPEGLLTQDFIVIVVGSVTAADPCQWHLVIIEPMIRIDNGAGVEEPDSIFAVISGTSSDPPTVRRQSADNTAGSHLHSPLHFDMRGISGSAGVASGRRRLFLCLVAETTAASNKFLYSYRSYNVAN